MFLMSLGIMQSQKRDIKIITKQYFPRGEREIILLVASFISPVMREVVGHFLIM